MMEDERRTPGRVPLTEVLMTSDFTQNKDTDFPIDLQVVPCFSCAFWNECGRFVWIGCSRFGLWLKLKKEEYRHERTA